MYLSSDKQSIQRVIKVGTFCRTMWVLFPLAAGYKLIRQVIILENLILIVLCREALNWLPSAPLL